jgi:hypothetical protein
VTNDGAWRWPVFTADGRSILAIDWSENAVVRFAPKTGRPLDRWTLEARDRVVKLVGAHRDDNSSVLVLIEGPEGPRAAELTLGDGSTTVRDLPLPGDAKLLTHLYQSKRVYGQQEIRTILSAAGGGAEVTNVEYRPAPGASPIDVTACSDRDCGQASLAPNGRFIVYIKRAP